MPATATTISSNRLGVLDLVRFLATLVVFFAHYTDAFNVVYQIVPANLKYTVVFRYSLVSLLVLFIISGYVITMTSIKRDLKEFLVSRLSRIYPLFWVSCIVGFLLPKIIPNKHSYLAHVPLKTLWANLTMLPIAFGQPLLNPVFHSLMTELVFYIFIGFIIFFKLWNKVLLVITTVITFCVANRFLFYSVPAYVFFTPLVAGMLFYLIRVKHSNPWKLYTLLALNFFCALMSAKSLSEQLTLPSTPPNGDTFWIFVLIITFIYITFWLITLDKIRFKSNAILQLLSDITYPFYLFHIYFLFVYWYFRNTVQPGLLLLSILLLTLLTSWILNIFIEKPLSSLTSTMLASVMNVSKMDRKALK